MSDPNRRYVLRRLINCTVEQQRDVLSIRNSDAVRKAMYTEHQISEAEHFGYVESLRDNRSREVFCVLRDGATACGVVSLDRVDELHRKADWAFYLGQDERNGVGSALELFLLDYVFRDLSLEKLNCEVLETNRAVVSMHQKFGFVEEGVRRSNVEKNGVRIGVVLLGITRDEWFSIRDMRYSQISDRIDQISIRLAND